MAIRNNTASKSKDVFNRTEKKEGKVKANESIPKEKVLTFSFKFWDQCEAYGVGECDAKWFTGFLERLKSLEGTELKALVGSIGNSSLRFHRIDWEGKGVVHDPEHFSHIPKQYRDQAAFPWYQFQVSQAEGRFVGFFNEAKVFCIAIIDKGHNLQPSQYNDHEQRPASVTVADFTYLQKLLDQHKLTCSNLGDLEIYSRQTEYDGCVILFPQHTYEVISSMCLEGETVYQVIVKSMVP